MKKRHAADLAAEEAMIIAIRSADHFMASLFRGVGVYQKETAPTVLAAMDKASELEQAAPGTMRSMIYAIAKDGRATLLTRELIQRLLATPSPQETTMKTPKKAAKKVAKKAPVKAAAKAATAASDIKRSHYDWKDAEQKALSGTIPPKPDFSAPTHKSFLPKFDEIVAACKPSAGSPEERIKALKAVKINPVSSTPKAMDRYRNLCVKALTGARA